MNLHVTNDSYGYFPSKIAKRLRASPYSANNLMVNISTEAVLKDELIRYIPDSSSSFQQYINALPALDKIIFHPYNASSFHFLSFIKKRFPRIKVYWICWSYELYKQPQFGQQLYEPFSSAFMKNSRGLADSFREFAKAAVLELLHITGLRKNYSKDLVASYRYIDCFGSFLPGDYQFFVAVSGQPQVKYIPFSYLSLTDIMHDPTAFSLSGDEVMIGHSASPGDNHYEIIRKIASIDAGLPVFLPLVYGNTKYAAVIKKEAAAVFKNISIQEERLSSNDYCKRLTRVGWAVINSKIQQGLGNILALLWIGTKLFLDENTSTYKDFRNWGIVVFTVQHDLTKVELSQKLTKEQAENNRRILYERFNEDKVNSYWQPLMI